MLNKFAGVGVVGLAVLVAFLWFDRAQVQAKYTESQEHLATAGLRISDLIEENNFLIKEKENTNKILEVWEKERVNIYAKGAETRDQIADAESSVEINIDSSLPSSLVNPLLMRWQRAGTADPL